MYFEHTINYLIYVALEKKRVGKKTANQVIRSANLDAKLSWVLVLSGLPPFNESHRKVIFSVATERNAFVHYKWDSGASDAPGISARRRQLESLLAAARKAVTYMRSYEARYLYKSKKQSVRRVLKSL